MSLEPPPPPPAAQPDEGMMTTVSPTRAWRGGGGPLHEPAARYWPLWLLMAIAVAARLPMMLGAPPGSSDDFEIINLATNLATGQGYFLDIKTHWGPPVPAIHYGGYEQPILAPALLAPLQGFMPDAWAHRIFGPLVFLLALGAFHQALHRVFGRGMAGAAGLLLALQPLLFAASASQLGPPVRLLCFALLVNSFFYRRSALLTGMSCSLGFLAAPEFLTFIPILFIHYLYGALRHGKWRALGLFIPFALIGPLWWSSFNLAMGAPLHALPGGHLFHALDADQGARVVDGWFPYDSIHSLLATEKGAVAERVRRNATEAFAILGGPHGALLLIPFVPIVLIAFGQDRQLARWWMLPGLALANLAWHVLSWPRVPEAGQLVVPIAGLLMFIAIGMHEILDREPVLRSGRGWTSGAALMSAGVALAWLLMILPRDARALADARRHAGGLFYRGAWVDLASLDSAIGMLQLRAAGTIAVPAVPFSVASNEPWLIQRRAGLPAVILPHDLQGRQWLSLLSGEEVDAVVICEEFWPEAHAANARDLAKTLEDAGWQTSPAASNIQIWFSPEIAAKPTGANI